MLIVFMYTQLMQAIFSAVQALLITLELCWGRRGAEQYGCAQITSASACEAPPHPLGCVARQVAVVVVEELIEHRVVGLNLRLRRAAEKAIPLGEVDGMVEHVKLRERSDAGLRYPVLMNICHCGTPGVDIGGCPLLGVKQRMMHFHQPAGEDGMRGSGFGGRFRNCEKTAAALLLHPLGDLLPIEVPQVRQTTATGRVNCFDAANSFQHRLLAEETRKYLHDDAIADAEEDVQWSWDDAIRCDGEESWLMRIE